MHSVSLPGKFMSCNKMPPLQYLAILITVLFMDVRASRDSACSFPCVASVAPSATLIHSTQG